MKKIPSLFRRDYKGTGQVYDEVTPGCEWVLSGEGVPTRKLDGTACLVEGGKLYRRYDAKPGRTPPEGFRPCAPEPDPITRHWPGWLPVRDGPEDRWHREGFINSSPSDGAPPRDGTYELVGPKVGGNPERYRVHVLLPHGNEVLEDLLGPVTFGVIHQYLAGNSIEGVVWHHRDGRMAKIKRRDFGLPWPLIRGKA